MPFHESSYQYNTPREKRNLFNSAVHYLQEIGKSIIQPIIDSVERKREIMLRKISAMLMLGIGGLFFLNGLALFINEYLGTSRSVGYLLIGLLLLLIGLIKQRN